MPEGPLTDRVRQLILNNIPSILQLEILLHLYAARPRFLSLQETVRPLGIELEPLKNQLEELQRRGLVFRQASSVPAFAYASLSPEQDAAVGELAEAYRSYRASVISQIYSRPTESIRAFADAFRLRKDEELTQ